MLGAKAAKSYEALEARKKNIYIFIFGILFSPFYMNDMTPKQKSNNVNEWNASSELFSELLIALRAAISWHRHLNFCLPSDKVKATHRSETKPCFYWWANNDVRNFHKLSSDSLHRFRNLSLGGRKRIWRWLKFVLENIHLFSFIRTNLPNRLSTYVLKYRAKFFSKH